MAGEARIPDGWLDRRSGDVASDLDLAVLLVNTYDALDDPPDRLQDLGWLRAVLHQVGHGAIARALRVGDLTALRDLRTGLEAVFAAPDAQSAARVLNHLLESARAVPALVAEPGHRDRAHLEFGHGLRGIGALQTRLPAALALHIDAVGSTRLGVCAATPCHCAFVDRTRGGTRRYCCDWCNDRAAAAAYRRRRG